MFENHLFVKDRIAELLTTAREVKAARTHPQPSRPGGPVSPDRRSDGRPVIPASPTPARDCA